MSEKLTPERLERRGYTVPHDVVLDQRALGQLHLFAAGRLGERSALPRRKSPSDRAVRRYQRDELPRARGRHAPGMLEPCETSLCRGRAGGRQDRAGWAAQDWATVSDRAGE